jgi:proteasome lid subunit RPN8/RPN11
MTVTASAVAAIVAHARAAAPEECCGLLGGTGDDVRLAVPVVNELASPLAYRTEPKSHLRATKVVRAAGLHEVGVYHSHPTSAAVPSVRDLAEWTYGEACCVIVGLGGEEPVVRAWRLSPSFVELAFAVVADESVN